MLDLIGWIIIILIIWHIGKQAKVKFTDEIIKLKIFIKERRK